jgi:hypothetical protein
MRTAGIYVDEQNNGGRWELAQALRWATVGQVFKSERGKLSTWVDCSSGFRGCGFTGGKSEVVLQLLVHQYAPMRWPEHGEMQLLPVRC